MFRQWLNLILILLVSLLLFAGWELFRTLSGFNSDFNYVLNPVDPGLLSAQTEKLITTDPDYVPVSNPTVAPQ